MEKNKIIKFLLKSEIVNWICDKNKIILSILFFLICIGVVYASFLFLTIDESLQKETEKIKIRKLEGTGKIKFPRLKKRSYYEAPLREKDIFKGIGGEGKEVTKDISYKFVNQLQLKGIMGGKKAVIEDPSNNKTWLVGEGEKIRGVEVRKVESSRVTLYYKGKFFNLSL